MGTIRLTAVCCAALLGLASPWPGFAKPLVIAFRAPSGDTYPASINSASEIAGYETDDHSGVHGFVRSPDGTFAEFDVLARTFPASINDDGTVTGGTEDADGKRHGFLRASDGSVTTFDAPGFVKGTDPTAINALGTVTGYFLDGGEAAHGFVRDPSGAVTAFDAPGAGTSEFQGTFATAINASGTVAGYYIDSVFKRHGFIRAVHGGVIIFDEPDAGPFGGTAVSGINAAGTVCGGYVDPSLASHGFLRTVDGNFTAVSVRHAINTGVGALNDQGAAAVGAFTSKSVSKSYARSPSGRIKVIRIHTAGRHYSKSFVRAINASGDIVGYFRDPHAGDFGFLRTH